MQTIKDLVKHKWEREGNIVQVQPYVLFDELREFLITNMKSASIVTRQYYMNIFDLTEEDLHGEK